jgi:hypothetical protein
VGESREVREDPARLIAREGDAVELNFPPLRSMAVALPLALFGGLAAAVPGVAVAALLPTLIANAGNLLAAVLIASFVLPFVVFGALLVVVAIYMLANALHVRADASAIETTRLVFGAIVRRRRVARADIVSIEPQIPTRYQSLFAGAPSYHLYARTGDGRRIVVAETLAGEAAMERIKGLIENPAAT